MVEFTGLKILHQGMMNLHETRAVFPFEYNGKPFSCIFLVDVNPFRLYITTLGTTPLIIELEIEKGYRAKDFIDNYYLLIKYLDLKKDKNHIFKPKDFFEYLNKKIPNKFKKKPDYKEVLKIASKRRNIEEINKIYFCGWYTNPSGRKVRLENLEKTRSAFGSKKAKMCSDKNISSCWTNIETDENLKNLNLLISL